jgi:hypothetical protein
MYIKADIMIGTNESLSYVVDTVTEIVQYNNGIPEDILSVSEATGGVRFVIEFGSGVDYDNVIDELSLEFGGEVSTFIL